jgi:hypothetical protein
MRAMITAYREDNDDVEFKLIHVFARIEMCDKWSDSHSPTGRRCRRRHLISAAKICDGAALFCSLDYDDLQRLAMIGSSRLWFVTV